MSLYLQQSDPQSENNISAMMTVDEIMTELKSYGSDNIKRILMKHGVREPLFGVKVEQLKTIQKRVKMDYELSRQLFMTGNADAMYLAGLIADDGKMTRDDLNQWAEMAVSSNISEYTVPWVAAGSKYGFELALRWIDSEAEHIAAAGWGALGNWVALRPDSDLDIPMLKNLLKRVEQNIHSAPNRVRYVMNGFIIAVGTYVASLTANALASAEKIGGVSVDMNGTACKLPEPQTYIRKVIDKGTLGKKKKTVKC